MTVAKKTAIKVVAKKKTTATKTVKKSNPPKATKPKTVKTQKQISALVNQSKEHKLAVWKETETANELVMKDWGGRLATTKVRMEKLNKKYEELLLVLLNEAYSVYREVVKSDLADDFFGALWNQLYKDGIKVQSNTPNASLVVRYICGSSISTKTVSNYAKVLEGADYNNIKQEQFIAWVQHKTMTRVVEDQRNIENNKETRAERMARARAVIMRLIEVRETKPMFSWTTTAWNAEKQISSDSLWVGIGNAHRILDGGSNFNASMNLIMMLPVNAEMEKHILNIYARVIVDDLEHNEKRMNDLEEKIWADELWEKLVSAGYEESQKQDEYWANRQQAQLFENQQDFDKFVKAKKKKSK
ncbi:hypothetical protein C2751_07700 [Polynucleobacter paneuropaeus]|uniref:hypothetical protein n=1 Tax=Polynucleobacter paneuropaeus TaxID=2527775 RepID=UPI001BFDC16A|nr:hypothetical protein [Polynucleobacter paneuropaeus]MBT8635501.1 hypothetical protein [Polynucleobacter paneuropaeus]